ncbi:MAG TPA: hypothetical protein VJ483_09705 [Holophagaceae bacterium]|nr:hypothetical protein [Holophagaceae bacterium]
MNPYEAPQAELLPSGMTGNQFDSLNAKVYSPTQVRVGTFLCGPLAGVWYLKSNFDAMQSPEHARKAVAWGIAACCLVLAIMLILPERFPRVALPIAYSWPAGYFVESYQLKKNAILESERYSMQSNWRVAGIGIIAFVTFFAIAMGLIYALNAMGVLHLA